MAYNTRLRSSAAGCAGRQSDDLLANLQASLSLEDGNFGGDDDSFAMVLAGGGPRCSPTVGGSGAFEHGRLTRGLWRCIIGTTPFELPLYLTTDGGSGAVRT
jgi:hypothetical protein